MKNLSFIVLSVLFLAACQSSTDELASPDKSLQIAPRSQRAFHATLSGALNLESEPTVCSGDLPLPLLDYFISGNATHLGKLGATSFLHHDDCNVDFLTTTLTASVSGNLVGVNGDWIEYTGEDEVNIFNFMFPDPEDPSPSGPITGSWTITGGTGRYENATGSFDIIGTVDFTTLSFSVVADGTITY